jgi:hypothetical protein
MTKISNSKPADAILNQGLSFLVLVIEYCDLDIVCNLVLEFCDFISFVRFVSVKELFYLFLIPKRLSSSSIIGFFHLDKKHEKGRDDKHGKNGGNCQPPEHHTSQPPVKLGSRTGNQNQGQHAEYTGGRAHINGP